MAKVKIMTRLVLSIATLAAFACLGVASSQAQSFSNAPWCAVRNVGAGGVQWDCEYSSVEACAPTVVAGNRGFCNPNPHFGNPPVSTPSIQPNYQSQYRGWPQDGDY
jgi:hypothetical protein